MAFKKLTYATGEEARINTVEPIRSKEDIKRIIQWFDSKKWHKYAVIFELGVNSGLRISDILGLKVSDVQGAKIALREQKTGKVKMFPLKEDLQKLLADWVKGKPNDAWCFEGRKDRKLDRSQVYRRINEAIEALEIDANVGTHTLRKTFGYHHFRQYNNITLLQEIFNHTSPDVTKRYIGITQDEIDDTYLNLNLDRNVDSDAAQQGNADFLPDDAADITKPKLTERQYADDGSRRLAAAVAARAHQHRNKRGQQHRGGECGFEFGDDESRQGGGEHQHEKPRRTTAKGRPHARLEIGAIGRGDGGHNFDVLGGLFAENVHDVVHRDDADKTLLAIDDGQR